LYVLEQAMQPHHTMSRDGIIIIIIIIVVVVVISISISMQVDVCHHVRRIFHGQTTAPCGLQ